MRRFLQVTRVPLIWIFLLQTIGFREWADKNLTVSLRVVLLLKANMMAGHTVVHARTRFATDLRLVTLVNYITGDFQHD